jgi:hypothetical protein
VEVISPSKSKLSKAGTGGLSSSTHRSQPEVVTLTHDQLTRMLKPSLVLSPEDIAAQRREQLQKREAAQAVSQVCCWWR